MRGGRRPLCTIRVGGKAITASYPAASAITGLVFPAPSGQALDNPSFLWNPVTLAHWPATYIWRVNYESHNGYYTNQFYTNAFNQDFVVDKGYYGCHPYPVPPTTGARQWEVSANFGDMTNGAAVSYGVWYRQAVVVSGVSLRPTITYYYDLDNGLSNVATTYQQDFIQSGTAALIFGDNPWTNTSSESLHGTFRALQIYATNLTTTDFQLESANHTVNRPVTSAGLTSIWYMNQNPTPTDIADKSGNGNHPAWLNANRPALYTG